VPGGGGCRLMASRQPKHGAPQETHRLCSVVSRTSNFFDERLSPLPCCLAGAIFSSIVCCRFIRPGLLPSRLPPIIHGMINDLRVHLLPSLFDSEEVRDDVVVILDILRASTTITHALAAGAKSVIPVSEVPEALTKASQFSPGSVLLGGERDGLHIEGFDLDNNPLAYTPDLVTNKTIIFTTTNGTRALLRSILAETIVIGSFVNLSAVVRLLEKEDRPVHLVCAGTRGKITLEDTLCAGAIADGLIQARLWRESDITDDQTWLARNTWKQVSQSEESLRTAMFASFGGRNCHRLGFDEQIERAVTRDLFNFVPVFDAETGCITAPR